MRKVDDVDLHGWFQQDELEPCPLCGEHAGIRLPASGALLCLACGGVGAAAESPAKETHES